MPGEAPEAIVDRKIDGAVITKPMTANALHEAVGEAAGAMRVL